MSTARTFWRTTITIVSGVLLLLLSISDYLSKMPREKEKYVILLSLLLLFSTFSIVWIKVKMAKSLLARNAQKFLLALLVVFIATMFLVILFNLITKDLSRLIGLLAISAYFISTSLVKFLETKKSSKITGN